jgi:hypothetical protein
MAVSSNSTPQWELTTGDNLDNTTGNDQLLGEAGNDRIIWSPGDGSDLTEGGTLGATPCPDRSASLPKGTDATIPAATTRHRELPPLAPHRFAVWCDRSGSPLTVAGAAAALCKRTHRVPF